MAEFICADLHFNHGNIIKYEDRPFADKDDMNTQLIKNWNEVVSKEDTVWVLGDVAFASRELTKQLIGKLNGHKKLIMGNHDRNRSEEFWYECGFEFVSRWPIIHRDGVVFMHEPPTYWNEHIPYFYVYGHVHGDPDFKDHTDHSACVSIERLNYRPALLERVLNGQAYERVT